MTVYGYARVSTSEQADEYDALKQQVKRLENAGAEVVLVDIESGRKDSRKNYRELIRLIERGLVSKVIITRVDRLGRTTLGVGKFVKTLLQNKVELIILDSPADPDSPFGMFNINLYANLAEFESSQLSQRIKHGMSFARENLKNHHAPFGYVRDENQRLIPDSDTWGIAREIVDAVLQQGRSTREISNYLLEKYSINFSPSGIGYWLKNPTVQGHTVYFTRGKKEDRKIIYDTHKPLISYDEGKTIEDILKNRAKHFYWTGERGSYPLFGCVYCAHCGSKMYRSNNNRGLEYLRCRTYFSGNRSLCTNNKTVRLDFLIKYVIDEIKKQLPQIIKTLEQYQGNNLEEDNEEISRLKNEVEYLKKAGSENPVIKKAIADLDLEIERIKLRKKSVNAHEIKTTEELKIMIAASSCQGFWDELTEDKLKKFLSLFLERITIDSSKAILVSMKSLFLS